MNIILDPYLFNIEEEDEIKINIPVFNALINVCKSGHATVFVYKVILERMRERSCKPFPIQVGKIKNDQLRDAVLKLNTAFTNAIMSSFEPLDVDECGGGQDYFVDSNNYEVATQLRTDKNYIDLLFILLQNCYSKSLTNCIVTGIIKNGRKIGDEFSLGCECVKEYREMYKFCSIEDYQSEKERALVELNRMQEEGHFIFVESPIIVRGKHHNKLQFNSNFTTYEGLSRTNKSVISLLRHFGLNKIIFGEYHEDESRVKGTITTYDTFTYSDRDIVKGWLFAETGYRNHVDLYFPKGVGANMVLYLENLLCDKNVKNLMEAVL